MKTPHLAILAFLILAASCTKEAATQDLTDDAVCGECVEMSASSTVPSYTKTHFGTFSGGSYSMLWNTSGESVKLVEIAGGNAAVCSSTSYTTNPDCTTAEFIFKPAKNTGKPSYNYYAVSPASALTSATATELVMNVPSVQTQASSGSPDAAALQLTASSKGYASQPTAISLNYSHAVAYGKIQICKFKPFTSSESVKSVTFKAEGKVLAGDYKINVSTGVQVAGSTTLNSITCNICSSFNTKEDFYVFFGCRPFILETNAVLNVTISTDKFDYTRQVTITKDSGVEFAVGQITRFSLDMSDADTGTLVDLETVLAPTPISNYITDGNAANIRNIAFDGTYFYLAMTGTNPLTGPDYVAPYIVRVALKDGSKTTFTLGSDDPYLGYTGGISGICSIKDGSSASGTSIITSNAVGATTKWAEGRPDFNVYYFKNMAQASASAEAEKVLEYTFDDDIARGADQMSFYGSWQDGEIIVGAKGSLTGTCSTSNPGYYYIYRFIVKNGVVNETPDIKKIKCTSQYNWAKSICGVVKYAPEYYVFSFDTSYGFFYRFPDECAEHPASGIAYQRWGYGLGSMKTPAFFTYKGMEYCVFGLLNYPVSDSGSGKQISLNYENTELRVSPMAAPGDLMTSLGQAYYITSPKWSFNRETAVTLCSGGTMPGNQFCSLEIAQTGDNILVGVCVRNNCIACYKIVDKK